MTWKILSAIIAVVLLVAYLAPIVLRVREPALTLVIVIGLALMLVDLWQSLQSKGD